MNRHANKLYDFKAVSFQKKQPFFFIIGKIGFFAILQWGQPRPFTPHLPPWLPEENSPDEIRRCKRSLRIFCSSSIRHRSPLPHEQGSSRKETYSPKRCHTFLWASANRWQQTPAPPADHRRALWDFHKEQSNRHNVPFS